jgi:small subunit ribosomal protein S4
MARYTGPKHKLARREGVNLLDKTSASLARRLMTPPGVHGKKPKRRLSEYGLQLREKQKAKATYQLLERQFSKLVSEAGRLPGDSSDTIIALLETRLDNVVYRLGFAPSRFMSRQLVSHRHILVNGKKLSIPSYQVKVNDTISLSSKMQEVPAVKKAMEEQEVLLSFLEKKDFSGTLTRMPVRADVELPFAIQQIIEYYSR